MVLRACLALPIVVGVFFLASPGSQAADPAVDVQVSVLDARKCRPFAEQLPVLFEAGGLQPDDRTPRVDVCVRNKGRMSAVLALAVVERTESEVACTGDEPPVDPTCAAGQPGELGDSLIVLVTTQADCRGPTTAPIELPLVGLESAPVVLDAALRPNRTTCVGLQLEYRPASAEAAAASQTDNVRWRFAFSLST